MSILSKPQLSLFYSLTSILYAFRNCDKFWECLRVKNVGTWSLGQDWCDIVFVYDSSHRTRLFNGKMQKTKKPSSKPTKKPIHQMNQMATHLFDTLCFDWVEGFVSNLGPTKASIYFRMIGGGVLVFLIFFIELLIAKVSHEIKVC